MAKNVHKYGEQASPSIHTTKKKPRTRPVKKIIQEDIEKILRKHSPDYDFSKRELEEIEANDSEMNKFLNLKLKKKMQESEAKKQQLTELFDS